MNSTRNIFEVPIYQTNYKDGIKSIEEYCLLCKTKDKGRLRSNRKGWQSNDLVAGKNQDIDKLVKLIETESNKFAKAVGIEQVKVANIWININGENCSNREHKHPYSVFSGTYYVNCNEESGAIYFINPSMNGIEYDWKDCTTNLNSATSPEIHIKPKVGDLLIFPSWLSHGVEINNSKNFNRISISFNTLAYPLLQ